MTPTKKGPVREGIAAGPLKLSCGEADNAKIAHNRLQTQTQREIADGQVLRLVTRPSRPRRLDIRIAAADGHSPIGRARNFRLTDNAVAELVTIAARFERRP